MLFFDVGGTLLQFNIEPSQLFSKVLKDHGIAAEPAQLYRTMREVESLYPLPIGASATSEGDYWRAFDGRILERLGIAPTPDVLDEVAERFRNELSLDAFPESVEVLRALWEMGVPLGIISNASHGILGDLARNHLSGFFEHVVYSQAVGAAKPDARIFHEALRLFGAPPELTWHVGDNVEADVAGARAVGIHPVLVDRHKRHVGVAAPRVEDLRDLVAMVEEA